MSQDKVIYEGRAIIPARKKDLVHIGAMFDEPGSGIPGVPDSMRQTFTVEKPFQIDRIEIEQTEHAEHFRLHNVSVGMLDQLKLRDEGVHAKHFCEASAAKPVFTDVCLPGYKISVKIGNVSCQDREVVVRAVGHFVNQERKSA